MAEPKRMTAKCEAERRKRQPARLWQSAAPG